jgi:hypothetical protein
MDEEALRFSKARYEYCLLIFKKEDDKQEALEKKTQYYLSIVTLIIGAIFIKLDFIPTLHDNKLVQEIFVLNIAILISLSTLFISLLIALFAIFQSIRIRKLKNYYPEKIRTMLFNPESGYLNKNNMIELYDNSAMCFALAIENKKIIIEKKAIWLQTTAIFFSISIISLGIFLGLFIIINFL